MNMHNARLTPQGRLLLVQRVTGQSWTVRSAAGAAGLSEHQAYRWLARYRAGGAAGLIDRSSAPQRCRHRVSPERVAAIERWRRRRLSGPAIARQLGMRVSTVGGILRRRGLGKLAALEPRSPVVRYQRARPGELIHIDTKKLGRIAAVGHRITGDRRHRTRGAGWEAVHVCIDDASRLAYGEVLPDERKGSAVPFLERAVGWFARHGVTVEGVMTDNGSAYRSHRWRTACGALALRHIRTRPYTPRTNGKAERFIQTSLREWAYARPFATSHDRTAAPLGSTITTPPGRTPLWPISRPPPACANRRSSVRPTRPFLRRDCHHPRPVRRGGARSAAGDRRQPARSVLAAPRRTGQPQPGGSPCLST